MTKNRHWQAYSPQLERHGRCELRKTKMTLSATMNSDNAVLRLTFTNSTVLCARQRSQFHDGLEVSFACIASSCLSGIASFSGLVVCLCGKTNPASFGNYCLTCLFHGRISSTCATPISSVALRQPIALSSRIFCCVRIASRSNNGNL